MRLPLCLVSVQLNCSFDAPNMALWPSLSVSVALDGPGQRLDAIANDAIGLMLYHGVAIPCIDHGGIGHHDHTVYAVQKRPIL